jgi:hypothetical protein
VYLTQPLGSTHGVPPALIPRVGETTDVPADVATSSIPGVAGGARDAYDAAVTTPIGLLLNVLLRLGIAYYLGEVMARPNDRRFAGKAIPLRNLIVVGGLSLAFPSLQLLTRRWRAYPLWSDNLYLSIFWLDMAGNSLDLYDRHYYFDLLPHFHGTGALAAVVQRAFGLPALSALGLANAVHVLLEAQEYYTDVLFGTHNVRGVADTVNDLVVGLAGTAVYTWLAARRPG